MLCLDSKFNWHINNIIEKLWTMGIPGFYRMIECKRDRWFASSDCTVRRLVDYIVKAGEMRGA